MDPDMALCSCPGPDDTMAPSDSTGHPDLYGPSGSLALKDQHGLGCQPGPGLFMVLGSNGSHRLQHRDCLKQGHGPRYVPGKHSMPRCHHGHELQGRSSRLTMTRLTWPLWGHIFWRPTCCRWQPRLWESAGPSEVTRATDIHIDSHCHGPDMAPGSSPFLDITMDLSSKMAIHVSPVFITLPTLDLPLSQT